MNVFDRLLNEYAEMAYLLAFLVVAAFAFLK
jgi:hypothetical protein